MFTNLNERYTFGKKLFNLADFTYSVHAEVRGKWFVFSLDVKGIKDLCVEMAVTWKNGKGFIHDLKFLSNTKIGEGRKTEILAVLTGMLHAFELNKEQPEGLYTFGTEDAVVFAPRIQSDSLLSLFSYTSKHGNTEIHCEFWEYEDQLLSTFIYGNPDYVDEHGRTYKLLRHISEFERENNILYVWKAPKQFISLADIDTDDLKNLHIHDERVMHLPVSFPVGTVIHNKNDQMTYQVAKADKEELLSVSRGKSGSLFFIQPENSRWIDTAIMGDAWEKVDVPFAKKVDKLVYHNANNRFYIAIEERPNTVVVRNVDHTSFDHNMYSRPSDTEIMKKWEMREVLVDYTLLLERGHSLIEVEQDVHSLIFGKVFASVFKYMSTKEIYLLVGLAALSPKSPSEITYELLKKIDEKKYSSRDGWKNEFIEWVFSMTEDTAEDSMTA